MCTHASMTGLRRLVVILLACAVGTFGMSAGSADVASAGTLRTKVFDFNACDQYQVSGHSCSGLRADLRADAIAQAF